MPSYLRGALSASGFIFVAMACSSDPELPGPTGPALRFSLPKDGLPAILEVPFPSDLYLTNGRIVDPLPGITRILPSRGQYLTHELAKMDGFSRIAMTHFYVDDLGTKSEIYPGPIGTKIDPASLPRGEVACASATSSVFLVDLEADATNARIPCRAEFHTDTDRSVSHPNLAIGPAHGILLKEGHRYATVVTSRVKDVSGKPIGASDDWKRILKGERSTPGETLYVDALALVKARLADVLGADEIVGIAPFTTHKLAGELFKLRDAVNALPPPSLKWDADALSPMAPAKFTSETPLPAGFTASLDDYLGVVAPTAKLDSGVDDTDLNLPVRAHDQILTLGTGSIEVSSFLNVPPGSNSNSYDSLDFATLTRDASGNFVSTAKERVWISFAIPKTPMPPGGYPVVIYAHGLSESRHVLTRIANTYAAKGWVTASIDSITFGARSRNPNRRKDERTDYENAPGAKYKGPDGIADADLKGDHQDSVDLFGSFYNLGAPRDQLRQSAIDMAEVVRALAGADLTPLSPSGAPIKIDGDRIAYQGNSLGAVEGTLFAATEPRVKSYILGVVGGGLLSELASGSPDLNQLLTGGLALNFDVLGDFLNASNPIVSLVQTAIEPGDPLLYAPHLVIDPKEIGGVKIAPRNILATEVFYDHTIPNEANEAFMRAAGLGVAAPNLGSNAQILDIKNVANNAWRVPIVDVPAGPDGFIHDTPIAGVTALVIQVSPGVHGEEFLRSSATRNAEIPYGDFASGDPFRKFTDDRKVRIRNPYRALQTLAVQFFGDTFSGKTPAISGIPPVVRDADDDGTPDELDPNSNDRSVK